MTETKNKQKKTIWEEMEFLGEEEYFIRGFIRTFRNYGYIPEHVGTMVAKIIISLDN